MRLFRKKHGQNTSHFLNRILRSTGILNAIHVFQFWFISKACQLNFYASRSNSVHAKYLVTHAHEILISCPNSSFILKVVSRWWNMFTALPYPDRIALKLVSFCPGKVNMNMTLFTTINVATHNMQSLNYILVKNVIRKDDAHVIFLHWHCIAFADVQTILIIEIFKLNFCAGSFSKEFKTDSDEICQLVNNSCLQTCLKKGKFYLSRPRHSVN